MLMESGVILQSEANLHSENIAIQDRDHGVASSAPINIVPQQPVKKPTRQWAAWTRQEEESFFTALRQVGKNFEKITCRVQSKNKDQVRHYYYRLVRRMNKLLGPGLYLDAKNSKDTNAAMLRWWSLLEKYSCKASKLHLKPRRFKIFVEALEHQLLKDRKKSVRKRPSHGEYGPPVPSTVSNQSRVPGQDNRTVKLVLVESQNIQKVGSGKASSKRNVNNVNTNRGNIKGDSATMKPARQRRKPAVVSSAAYKKWEKAAIAGVSLVADAAEHLERTAIDKEVEQDQNTSGQTKSSDPVGQVLHSLPTFTQNPFVENNIHSSTKLKLQLFPIDDGTRRALEMDKHNPHLELTLSNRKKISSVLEHLNRKWGSSSIASGELMLFPYGAQRENLVGCPRWTQDSVTSAADVHAMIGGPQVFRLRYGWFPAPEHALQGETPAASCCFPREHDPNMEKGDEAIMSSASISRPSNNYQRTVPNNSNLVSVNKNHTCTLTSTNLANARRYDSEGPVDNLVESSDPTVNKSLPGKGADDEVIMRHLEDMDGMRLCNGMQNHLPCDFFFNVSPDSQTAFDARLLLQASPMASLQGSVPTISVIRTCCSSSSSSFTPTTASFALLPEFDRRTSAVGRRLACLAMVQQSVQGAPAAYAKEMERLSAKESLLLAFKDAGGFEALVSGKTTDMHRIDVNERITGLERLNPTPRPTTSPFLEGRWNFDWFGSGSPGLFVARFIFERFPSNLANLSKMDALIKDGYANITANLRVLNSIESKFILSTKLSVEGPLRMKEEYVEGILETPKVIEETVPDQLKGALDQAGNTIQQLPKPVRDAFSGGLKVPLSGSFQRLFMISYLDDEILIIRDASGVPEVLTRLDTPSSPLAESVTEYES